MSRPQKYDHVVQEITDRAKTGRYKPGDRLTVGSLSREFGIGQGTAVMAMKLLAAQGVVHQKPGTDGYRISPPRDEDDDDAIITTCPACHALISLTLKPA
jgi:DNA-binding GntR family transcriptional regulator